MKRLHCRMLAVAVFAALAGLSAAWAQAPQFAPAGPAAAPIPPDPWPRVVDLSTGQVLVYQPQINKWTDNQLDFRAAMAFKKDGSNEQAFGVVFATTRTQVDKALRTVVFEDLKISKIDFPTLPDRGAAFGPELTKDFAAKIRTMSLDKLQASLAAAGIKPQAVAVNNAPPQVLVSYSPAILVPIDGAPVIKPVASAPRFNRVINTRALILQGGIEQNFYIHVYDGWLSAGTINGPWTQSFRQPFGMDDVAAQLAKSNTVDLLDGGPKANPKPSLANGVPTIYTSQVPTELIVFKGQADFVPIVGTQLLWASNTTSDVLIDTASNNYDALLAGRWFRAPAVTGPWQFVGSDALPADFARIPATSMAGAVLPTVAGTPQAQAAVIENSIPQTATVPLKGGPTFTPNFDGPPQYAPVPGTTLSYVVNSSEPVIQVAPNAYYAVTAGVWFTAPHITGPWIVATAVPSVIYTIPPSSPIHYVTYVRVYGTTPQYVYVGYTPGYLGPVVSPYGTVVYGTGYAYSPWIGSTRTPATAGSNTRRAAGAARRATRRGRTANRRHAAAATASTAAALVVTGHSAAATGSAAVVEAAGVDASVAAADSAAAAGAERRRVKASLRKPSPALRCAHDDEIGAVAFRQPARRQHLRTHGGVRHVVLIGVGTVAEHPIHLQADWAPGPLNG